MQHILRESKKGKKQGLFSICSVNPSFLDSRCAVDEYDLNSDQLKTMGHMYRIHKKSVLYEKDSVFPEKSFYICKLKNKIKDKSKTDF